MRQALHAEWTKLRTVSSTLWVAVSIVAGTPAIGSLAIMSLPEQCTDGFCDLTKTALSGVYLGQAAIVVLAVLALAPEYDTLMIRTTLAADPRRWRVLSAKAGVSTLIALAGGAVGVLCSVIAGRIFLSGSRFGMLPVDAAALRAYFGTTLYCGLIALLSIGVTAILRHTGGSITVVLTLLYTIPIVTSVVTDPEWRKWLLRLAPMTAGLAIQATRDLDALPIKPWPGLGVLTLYTLAAGVVAALLFHRRDA